MATNDLVEQHRRKTRESDTTYYDAINKFLNAHDPTAIRTQIESYTGLTSTDITYPECKQAIKDMEALTHHLQEAAQIHIQPPPHGALEPPALTLLWSIQQAVREVHETILQLTQHASALKLPRKRNSLPPIHPSWQDPMLEVIRRHTQSQPDPHNSGPQQYQRNPQFPQPAQAPPGRPSNHRTLGNSNPSPGSNFQYASSSDRPQQHATGKHTSTPSQFQHPQDQPPKYDSAGQSEIYYGPTIDPQRRAKQARQLTGRILVPKLGTGTYADNKEELRRLPTIGDKNSYTIRPFFKQTFKAVTDKPLSEEAWKTTLSRLFKEDLHIFYDEMDEKPLQEIVDKFCLEYDKDHTRPAELLTVIWDYIREPGQTLHQYKSKIERMMYKVEFTMETGEYQVHLDMTLRQKLLMALGPITRKVVEKAIYDATNKYHKIPLKELWALADTNDAVEKDYVPRTKTTTKSTHKTTTISAAAYLSSPEDSDSDPGEFMMEQLCATSYRPRNNNRRTPWSGAPCRITARAQNRPTYSDLLEMIHPLLDKANSRKRTHDEAMEEDPSRHGKTTKRQPHSQ